MTQKQFNFTQAQIDNLPLPPKGKRAYYRDDKEPGLIIDVRPSGSKAFYLYKKIAGKPERVHLGGYPDMKIPQARKLAAIKKGEIANGRNPQEEKRHIRKEVTLGSFFQDYMERYSKLHKKSWREDISAFKQFLSHWESRKLSSIKKHEVQKLHEEIGKKNGIYQANRALERVRALYNKAIEWGWEGMNPAVGIKKFKEKKRDRFALPSEIPLLLQAIYEEENEVTRDYFLISLMTGARKSNLLAMRWDEINWDHRVWRIPDTKNGEPVSVPLIDQAINILEARKRKTNSEWVFPGSGSTGHLADPKKSWRRIKQKATLNLWKQTPELASLISGTEEYLSKADNYGYTVIKLFSTLEKRAKERDISLPIGLMDIRIHDIRRTLGSYQAITGASLPIIGKTLGHKDQSSTAIYARLHDDPIRESITKATDMIFADSEAFENNE